MGKINARPGSPLDPGYGSGSNLSDSEPDEAECQDELLDLLNDWVFVEAPEQSRRDVVGGKDKVEDWIEKIIEPVQGARVQWIESKGRGREDNLKKLMNYLELNGHDKYKYLYECVEELQGKASGFERASTV